MVFQPFLDQSRRRPGRGSGHAVSLVLHGLVVLLIWLAWRHVEQERPPVPRAAQAAVSLRRSALRDPVLVGPSAPGPGDDRSATAGSRPPALRPDRTRAAPALSLPLSPDPAPTIAAPVSEDEPDGEPGVVAGTGSVGVETGGSSEAGGAAGEGGALGPGGVGRRGLELFGRVVGGNRREMMGARGLPFVSMKESTALRAYDFFPRLPASRWDGDRPYVIVIDVCVAADGQVSEAASVRPSSPDFDPLVLAAVRTWRYHPRVVEGRAGAFCHRVAIKYELL